MTQPLRVLIVEDSEDDAELLLRELRHGGYEPTYARVETAATLSAELAARAWDIVFSDFSMPQFDAFDALALLRSTGLDVPFIIVSGTIGEDRAVAAMKAGAHDYVLKDNLARLVPAVERELEQAGQRRVQRQTEEALRHARATEARLGQLLDESSDEIHILDAETLRFVQTNATARRHLGYSEDELRRMTPADLQSEFSVDAIAALLRPLRAGERDELQIEASERRKDGSSYPVEIRLRFARSEDPPVFVVIVRDITERQQLESQLRQSQKLEAVGQLAGGIAHDFNNILTAIRGYAEFARRGLEADPGRAADLDEVIANADRAAALVRQLLAFSRRQVLAPQVLEPAEIVAGIAPMLRRLLGEHIELATNARPDTGQVKVDPSQLEQVIVNLAVNARDAMPAGGALTIELGNVELDAAYAADHPEVNAGPFVLLAVSDTGSGMDAATRLHIFEPFFTTKEVGQGTGMGLATVYGIVRQSGGSIFVYSEPGAGTTFRIYFPRITAELPAALAEPVAVRPSTVGSETILLVEDESAVRAFGRRALESEGYTVLAAASGAGALTLAASHAGPIALLVTDVIMPGLQGHQLAVQLTAARPELRVLYVSGFTENSVTHHGAPDRDVAFLPKPFSADGLCSAVRAVLGGPAA
ncbi:MAG: response regulator [Candidatus Limnocylindrales bacterium]